ncbi:MAG TPA: histidine kinase [Candidatus Baltobacterales bacterium]|nr:histidine kinase [Candidatus Baltobacterales bacterium]
MSTTEVTRGVDADYRRELRASIARELHDGPIRELTACVVRLENFRTFSDNPNMQIAISAIEEHARAALMSMRNLIRDLRDEAPLEDLPDAIQAMIERYRKSSAAELTLVVSPEWPQLVPALVALNLLRVVQEAVHNAVRHGAADHILLDLRTRPGRLKVTITDDGDGISPGTPEGAGMIGMRERMALIGARLEVRHRRRGTVIDVEAPSA